MKKLEHGQPEGPVSVRMSYELQNQLDACALKTGMKVTDLMRLCMRIGMEHFRRIDYDTAKCIVQAVETSQPCQTPQTTVAFTADSIATAPNPPPTSPTAANIVPLPPPPVVATLLHQTMTKAAETTTSPPVTETRDPATTYPKRKKNK